MTKSIAIVQEERNQPMENFLQFIETYITHLWSVVLFDDLVICRWFLYTAKAWNLSIAIPDIKCWCFKSLQVKEQTQDREESSDDGDDKKPVEKFELVTVLVGKAGFQRNHLWKGHKWYLAKENLRNNVVVVKYLRKPFIQKCLKQRGLIVKNQEKTWVI